MEVSAALGFQISYQHPDVQSLAYALVNELGIVKTKTRILTNAEIKALPTTPIEIIPAPGAGKILFQMRLIALSKIVQSYTNIGDTSYIWASCDPGEADAIYLPNEAAFDNLVNSLLTGDGTRTIWNPVDPYANKVSDNYGLTGGVVLDSVDLVENKSFQIFMENSGSHTGNLTGGNAANGLQVTVFYSVIDVA